MTGHVSARTMAVNSLFRLVGGETVGDGFAVLVGGVFSEPVAKEVSSLFLVGYNEYGVQTY